MRAPEQWCLRNVLNVCALSVYKMAVEQLVNQMERPFSRAPEFPWRTLKSTPRKSENQEQNQPNGTFSSETRFQEGKLEQLLLWGNCLVLRTAERHKEKKENSETEKIGEQTKYKTWKKLIRHKRTTRAPNQPLEAARTSQGTYCPVHIPLPFSHPSAELPWSSVWHNETLDTPLHIKCVFWLIFLVFLCLSYLFFHLIVICCCC